MEETRIWSLHVMSSRWALMDLQWSITQQQWFTCHDRPLPSDDSEVRRLYGDEAFRRREILLETGKTWFDPPLAPLIGRRIVDQLTAAGWTTLDSDEWWSGPGYLMFRMTRGDDWSEVRLPHYDRWKLEVVRPGITRELRGVDEAEAWLLNRIEH